MKVENLYVFHQKEKAIFEEQKSIKEQNAKKEDLLAYSQKMNAPLYNKYKSKEELSERDERIMRKSYAQIQKLQKDIEENNLRIDELEKDLKTLCEENPELKTESDQIKVNISNLDKKLIQLEKDYNKEIERKTIHPDVIEEKYNSLRNLLLSEYQVYLDKFSNSKNQEDLTQQVEEKINLGQNIENSPEFLQWQEEKKTEQPEISEDKLTASEYLEDSKATLSVNPLIEAENQENINHIENIQNFSEELEFLKNQENQLTFDKEEMQVVINTNTVNLEHTEIEKIDFDTLSKQVTAQLVLELNENDAFKEIQKQKQEQKISYDIIDYLQDTIKEAEQKPELQEYYEFMKSQDIAVGEVALEQIQKDFPDLRGEALIQNAEKIGIDNLIKAVENTDDFKKLQQSFVLDNGQAPNVLDYLKKQVANTPMGVEQVEKLEQQIKLIEKHYPEMDNSFQFIKKQEQELTAEEKKLQIQKEKEKVKNSLANRIQEHLDKNSQGISQNPDQIAQEIMRDILLPLKVIEFNRNKISSEQKKDYNITVNLNGQIYKVLGYENNYEKIKLQDIQSQKQYTISNEKTFKVHFDGANLTPYQIDQLREGKKFIIASDSKTPIIATMKQGQIQFSTVDKTTIDKSIRAKKGIDIKNNKLHQSQSLIVEIKENKAPTKKNSFFKKMGFKFN